MAVTQIMKEVELLLFFPRAESGLLAGSGVLAAMPASAGMGGHHSSETWPNQQIASRISSTHLLSRVFVYVTLLLKGTAKVPRSLAGKDSLLSNAKQV